MKLKTLGTAAALILATAAGGVAENRAGTNPLTLEDCLRIARERNLALQRAEREIEIARGRIYQALGDALPNLTAGARYTYLDRVAAFEFDDQSVPVGLHNNYAVDLRLEQTVYSGGQVIAGMQAARLYNRLARQIVQEARNDLRLRVTGLFHRVVLAGEIVRVRRDSIEHLEHSLDITKKKYAEGTASEFDLLTARVKLANARTELIEAENRARTLHGKLARELELDSETFSVAGRLEYLPFDGPLSPLFARGREKRPLIEQARLTAEIYSRNVTATTSGYHPEVSVYGLYTGQRPRQGFPPDDRFEFEWQFGAQLRWNLFDGLLTPGRVVEARAQHEQARLDHDSTVRGVELEIERAWLEIRSARAILESQEENVVQAEKAFEIALVRWENGLSTYLELTDAELALAGARVNLKQALADYNIALAELEKAVGSRLREEDGRLAWEDSEKQ